MMKAQSARFPDPDRKRFRCQTRDNVLVDSETWIRLTIDQIPLSDGKDTQTAI